MICLLYDYLSCELDPEEEEIKVRQRRQSKKMSTPCFSRTRISENLDSFFFFANLFRILSFALFFFLCLSSLLGVLLPTLSSFLHRIVSGQLFRKGKNSNFKEQYVNCEIGSGFFPKMLPFFESVTLSGQVRISKTRHRGKNLSLLTLLLTIFKLKLKVKWVQERKYASSHVERKRLTQSSKDYGYVYYTNFSKTVTTGPLVNSYKNHIRVLIVCFVKQNELGIDIFLHTKKWSSKFQMRCCKIFSCQVNPFELKMVLF